MIQIPPPRTNFLQIATEHMAEASEIRQARKNNTSSAKVPVIFNKTRYTQKLISQLPKQTANFRRNFIIHPSFLNYFLI